ncbi:AAA family ATPase [Glaesserella parasuis]|uniref:AAA family ATPase n=1 Tax=Glaesserella parasuis TaxID=738 RepID=UPI000950210C|nr:AAA family ATPase [Glaesserella parasuis]MDG6474709.1 AAA family ATPase [Glaesserella parasuis]MDO9799946.1 AAA family ATPase [Glaesserella parasuis]MDO9851960.1 AAA family ATPase [Glaesserella parasuis]MDO9883189.1 AAA family ATPase [Glaesserella parasuis]MDO9885694.1 AAA family ATPase [Glaesserella parasuis]
MKISININKLQHIENGTINLDMEDRNIICIVGKNGVGKTSIIKSMYLTQDIAVFQENKSLSIYKDTNISISIHKDGEEEPECLNYYYDKNIDYLNTKNIIKSRLYIELPIPFGNRFTTYPTLAKIDLELREIYLKNQYSENKEIIDFLNKIYPNSSKFNELKEVEIKNKKYYFLINNDGKYIREDHLSSGEYFIINIYKMLSSKEQDVVIIDEIDISLDASTQVNLVRELNYLCDKFHKKIIFTSHSLVIMKTLYNEFRTPIYYLSNDDGKMKIIETSYGFVAGEMFGFQEYDKYIIVEDIVLEKYIRYILYSLKGKYPEKKIRTLYIGGAEEVKDFLKGSRFSILDKDKKDVIAILDGDKKTVMLENRILHIPFDNVEKELMKKCKDNEKEYNFPSNFSCPQNIKNPKKYYELLINTEFEYTSIIEIIEKGWENEIEELKNKILTFLRC